MKTKLAMVTLLTAGLLVGCSSKPNEATSVSEGDVVQEVVKVSSEPTPLSDEWYEKYSELISNYYLTDLNAPYYDELNSLHSVLVFPVSEAIVQYEQYGVFDDDLFGYTTDADDLVILEVVTPDEGKEINALIETVGDYYMEYYNGKYGGDCDADTFITNLKNIEADVAYWGTELNERVTAIDNELLIEFVENGGLYER